jgi:hypothetical protein
MSPVNVSIAQDEELVFDGHDRTAFDRACAPEVFRFAAVAERGERGAP